jgi:translation initiation factor IF-2
MVLKPLTDEEKAVRLRALSEARKADDDARKRAEENARRANEEQLRRKTEEEAAARRKTEEEARKKADEDARRKAEEQARKLLEEEDRRSKDQETREQATAAKRASAEGRPIEEVRRPALGQPVRPGARALQVETEEDEKKKAARGKAPVKRPGAGRPDRDRGEVKKPARLLLDEEERQRVPSLAALRRHRERERRQLMGNPEPGQFAREVVLPETITVQELAARMAVRSTDVVKVLMKNGIMAGPSQVIDADTAEIVVGEYGHKVKRVSEADVEIGIEGLADIVGDLVPRPPVVTVMGHVDHGKTSLLDALRSTNVVAGEAGGITQHIGAYQVDIGHGRPVTFIDTPGHAAFTAMRARGASVTDIVVLVVAADDGVMPQTIEAIRHAKAAKVPIIVAINKIDKPEANPDVVKQELLSHEVVVEDFGGDVQAVPVSALKRTGLAQLIEAIQLQAELLDLKANPDREAQGTIIEAKLDRGRGVAATVLVQRGTLKVGDIVVCGAAWGRVRALVDDKGEPIETAGPSSPVEILGLDDVPEAGDVMQVVDSERRAREISEYRLRKKRDQAQLVATGARSSLEDMFSALKSGELQELPMVIKSDVHGSLEAISAGLDKLKTDEVGVKILHGGVGAITESDVTLAMASKALIVGFNVRANAQARDMAKREGIEIRYYSIIYELLDEAKQMLSGMLAPEAREIILGHADVREVFNITKVGKIAGCRITDGLFKRPARARIIRDNVVVFDGAVGSLKRFKDDVREVKEGFECGIALEGYHDLRQGDVIEAYEVLEVARTL